MDPAVDLAAHVSLVVVSPTLPDVITGPVTPEPKGQCLFLFSTGGPPPDDIVGSTKSDRRMQVQVRVRYNVEKFRDGELLARAVWAGCHLANTQSPRSALMDAYADVRCLEAHPMYLGKNDDKCHEWSFTVQMRAIVSAL